MKEYPFDIKGKMVAGPAFDPEADFPSDYKVFSTCVNCGTTMLFTGNFKWTPAQGRSAEVILGTWKQVNQTRSIYTGPIEGLTKNSSTPVCLSCGKLTDKKY